MHPTTDSTQVLSSLREFGCFCLCFMRHEAKMTLCQVRIFVWLIMHVLAWDHSLYTSVSSLFLVLHSVYLCLIWSYIRFNVVTQI